MKTTRPEFPSIPRRIPPPGVAISPKELDDLRRGADALRRELAGKPREPDIEIYVKAVLYAIEHGEFFRERETGLAHDLLKSARARLDALATGTRPWTNPWSSAGTGTVVLGYVSKLDDSVQPYGLVIPKAIDLSRKVPLYVWLHGRADRSTDLQFIHQRERRPGTIQPEDAIVLHPFGRYCNAFKSAGEVDVFEAIDDVKRRLPIDDDRVALMGFSMGGAGAWQLGARHAERWVAVSPGAGFAETARYVKLASKDFPPWYEQALWGVHDVPAYVRNLFNVDVIAYSGEKDRQIQAARVMEEAYRDEGRELRHVIGPGMGHKYHPDSLAEILASVRSSVERGRNRSARSVSLQTRTLRCNRMYWVEILGLVEHWRDSRVDAKWSEDDRRLDVTTRNVTRLRISNPVEGKALAGRTLVVDLDEIALDGSAPSSVTLARRDGIWELDARTPPTGALRKRPGLQGPIDDAFLEPFIVVKPSKPGGHPVIAKWLDIEIEHFRDRWRRLFRGDPRVVSADEISDADLARYNVIAWGDPRTNRVIGRALPKLPLRWTEESLTIGKTTVDAATHVPALVYPNPLARGRYLVLNSGMTFREAHDRTNSLQNPKLPDWALLDVSVTPDDTRAGRVIDADFFDEGWKVRER